MEKTDNSLISVIVPVYNSEKYLDNCIQSLVCQTHTNLEIILVDDGSLDSSLELCKAWEKKDKRIKVMHKENGGPASARNVGLDNATGDYISFIDSDDTITENMLEYMLDTLNKYEADICQCGMEENRKNNVKMVLTGNEEVVLTEQKLWELVSTGDMPTVCLTTKIYKQSIWEDLRFPEGRPYEDQALLLNLFKSFPRIVVIPMPFYMYMRDHSHITPNIKLSDTLYLSGVIYERIDYLIAKNYAKCVRKSFALGLRLMCKCYKNKNFMQEEGVADQFRQLRIKWLSQVKPSLQLVKEPKFKIMMFIFRVNWPLYVLLQGIFER